MKGKRYSNEQIIYALKRVDGGERCVLIGCVGAIVCGLVFLPGCYWNLTQHFA